MAHDGDLADHLAARRSGRAQGQPNLEAGQVAGEQQIALGLEAVEHLALGQPLQIAGDVRSERPAFPRTRRPTSFAISTWKRTVSSVIRCSGTSTAAI